MRIFDFGLVFSLSFGAVFGVVNLATGMAPINQIENGANAVGNFIVSPGFADEIPAQPIDFSDLIRIGDREFEIHADSSVQTSVIGNFSIRKIAHGNVSEVKVVRTPSGTYSTDGFASPNVQYAGIEVSEKTPNPLAQFWQTGFGWSALPFSGNSFTTTFGRVMEGGHFVTNGEHTCISGKGYKTCR